MDMTKHLPTTVTDNGAGELRNDVSLSAALQEYLPESSSVALSINSLFRLTEIRPPTATGTLSFVNV